MKNITLNYENSKAAPVHVHNPKNIKRIHGGVVSEPKTKEYNVAFKKRRVMDNFHSLPYGHD